MRLCLVLVCWCSISLKANNWLESILLSDTSSVIRKVVAQPEKFRLQIQVTTIERDENGYPKLKRYQSDFWPKTYFFPASTFKLPLCFVALEKLRSLNHEGIDLKTDFYCKTDQCYPLIITDSKDNTTRFASLEDLMINALVFSDNYTPKILQEFVGKEFTDKRLSSMGLHGTSINNFPSTTQNHIKPAGKWAFWSPDQQWILERNVERGNNKATENQIFVGEKSWMNGRIQEKPWDFSHENSIELQDLHHLMEAIVLPELNILPKTMLQTNDLKFLQETLATWPRNKQNPIYGNGEKFPDNFRKFLFIGDLPKDSLIPNHITIANKVGMAYGFMTDVSYFHDKLSHVELIVSATIYVNENETINDGVYQYESIGLPFMGRLGRLLIEAQEQKIALNRFKAIQ